MIVSINQPAYMPWLGYFHRIAVSDLHVVLDHVQFEKNSFTNRNKVRTATGWSWLTVPVRTGGRFGELPISDLAIAAAPWQRKHWDTLRFAYARSVFFNAHEDAFRDMLDRDWPLLAPLMQEITGYLCKALAISTPRVSSSTLSVPGRKAELVLNVCRDVGATTYLSGPLGRDYLDPQAFTEAGIALIFHDYRHPQYRQQFPGFQAFMAAPDLLFNEGPDSAAILRRNQTALSPGSVEPQSILVEP